MQKNRSAVDERRAAASTISCRNSASLNAAEFGKVIEIYIRAYQVAELSDRVACVEQMTDEELMRIIRKGESTPPRLIPNGPR